MEARGLCAGADVCVRLSVGSACQLFGSVVTAGCCLPSTCNLAQPAPCTSSQVITEDHRPLSSAHSAVLHSASLQLLVIHSSRRGGMLSERVCCSLVCACIQSSSQDRS